MQPSEPTSGEALFDLQGVSLRRQSGLVLDNLHLRIPDHAFTCVMGPSGSGKSSLLRILNRLDDPSTGSVLFRGDDINSIPVQQLRRRVGLVAQTPVMFEGSVFDNLRLAQKLADRAASTIDFEQLMSSVELSPDMLTRQAVALSGGEKQRVALARSLLGRPEVLLLDEPTAALDAEVAHRLLALMQKLYAEHHLSIVMVTHRIDEALSAASYLVNLERGRITGHGPYPDRTPREDSAMGHNPSHKA